MISILRLVAVAMLAQIALFPAWGQEPPKREFRGSWLFTLFNIDWPSARGLPSQVQKDELSSMLDNLKAAGINAVVFSIRPECDALYQSSIEPWSYWLSGTQGSPPVPMYDPLEFAIAEAHKRGMELHAAFNPYRAVCAGASYPRAANHPTNTHPDWLITIGDATILDPGKAAVRAYTLGVIADVVSRFDIDGVVMDDYFYLQGTTTEDFATFAEENRGFTDLGDWRRDNVNILIRAIRDTVNAIKPWVKFGMCPAGIWKKGVPPGVTAGWDPYNDIYCDAVAWLQGATIDYISPQLYKGFGGAQDYALLEPWWGTQLNGRLYWPALSLGRSPEEIGRMIRFNRSTTNTSGNVLTPSLTIVKNSLGIADSLRNNLNYHPSLIPRIPWKDSVAPNPPKNLRFGPLPGTQSSALQWDLPDTAPDGDSASWYAVYRFDHRPSISELDSAQNLLAVEGLRYSLVSKFPPLAGPSYFVVTALDRNFNESDTSNVLKVTAIPPAAPILAYPPDGADMMPESLQVSWHAAASAQRYHLQIGYDPSFTTIGLLVDDSNVIDTLRLVLNPAGMRAYYWRVRAGNMAGFGDFTTTFTYTTGTPDSAVLVYPPAATPDIPNSLTFTWRKAERATSYRLQIALRTNFSSIVKDTSGVPDTSLAMANLALNTIHHWRVKGMNDLGSGLWSASNNFRTVTTGIESGDRDTPVRYELRQNYPNPFNPSTVIRYQLPTTCHVNLVVCDLLGREVAELIDERKSAGNYEVTFDATGLSSGIYFYRLTAGDFIQTHKMTVLR